MSEQNLAQKTTVRVQGYKRELLWLAPALLSATCVFYFYLESHPYPSFGAGLYMLIAERIIESGYALPETIPYYTEDGVPFAYPPLMFYVVAAIRDATGLGPIAVSRYLPGLVTIAYLVPTYLLARDLLNSRPQAAMTGLIVAVSPPVIRWHISAGGVVRAPAFLFAVTGIYAGLRLYRDRDSRWVVASLVLFTLTILTHPMYTVFFGLSYFLLYLGLDRTLWGLKRGALVGVGGVALAAPWWLQVTADHGAGVFTGAAGTHGGIGGGVTKLLRVAHLDIGLIDAVWLVVPVVGLAYLLRKRRYLLTGWLVVTTLLLGNARFSVFVSAFVISVFLLEGVGAWLKRESRLASRRSVVTVTFVLIAMVGVGGASMYASGSVDFHSGSPSQPMFIDDRDVEAMNWVSDNTASDATFVVQGDAAEWFPQQTRRTMLVGPWGVEWKGAEPYDHQLELYQDVSACNSASCMTATLAEADANPDYIYLPKGRFTVRGMEYRRTSQLAMSLHLSPQYHTVYENDGVIVFEVVDGE